MMQGTKYVGPLTLLTVLLSIQVFFSSVRCKWAGFGWLLVGRTQHIGLSAIFVWIFIEFR